MTPAKSKGRPPKSATPIPQSGSRGSKKRLPSSPWYSYTLPGDCANILAAILKIAKWLLWKLRKHKQKQLQPQLENLVAELPKPALNMRKMLAYSWLHLLICLIAMTKIANRSMWELRRLEAQQRQTQLAKLVALLRRIVHQFYRKLYPWACGWPCWHF